MRKNLLRRRLREGQPAVGHMIMEFSTRGIAAVTEAAGLDFVVLDMEHSGIGIERIADLLAWFSTSSVTPVVRVPAPRPDLISRCLDAGALGIMVPNVETAEQARLLVEASSYSPEGRRGLALGIAHTRYRTPDPATFVKEANAEVCRICQIESTRGLENLDSIAAVPGIDVLWVGHYDLTLSMGIVGRFDHPRFLAALEKVVAAAEKFGKSAGIQPGTPEQTGQWFRLGYRIVSLGTDLGLYRQALTEAVGTLRTLEES